MKLVITHAGLLTVQEAIWHRKLVLGIPLEIGQRRNIQRAIELGFAEDIDVHNFTSMDIVVKTRMLIENPIYALNVDRVSRLMKSPPLGPRSMALHWIEQLLQHDGLDHLKTEARRLSFFKLYMVDVAAVAAIIVLVYILIMQYHFIKAWVVKRERKRREAENRVMNEIDKLKSE